MPKRRARAGDFRYLDHDPDDRPCPGCGRYGGGTGRRHNRLGWVCGSCADVLIEPKMSGCIPTAYEDGRDIRMRRPNSNRL